jgi:hypothetical protein
LKRQCDYWQSCAAAIHALEEIEREVVSNYTTASDARRDAREQIAAAQSSEQGRRSWPPYSATTNDAAREFDALEGQWKQLQKGSIRALALVGQLGRLAAKYQAVAERQRLDNDRISQEQEQVHSLEMDLATYLAQWQEQEQVYQQTPDVSDEIQKLISDTGQESTAIQRQFLRGEQDYQGTYKALQNLARKVRYYQVTIDDMHAIDARGRVIAKR